MSGWEEAFPDAPAWSGAYLVARGLMAWTLAKAVGCTPEQAHEAIEREIVLWAQITPAAVAAIMTSAEERLRRET